MPTELMHGQPVRSVNLMMEAGGSLYEVCNLSFSERDESLYIRPVAPTDEFYFGMDMIPAHVTSFGLSWLGQHHVQGEQAKLSIHATGRVHVRLDPHRPPIEAGPIMGPSLQTMRDHHIATLIADEFTALRPVTRTTTMQGTEVDFGFPFDSHPTGRVAIYANAYEPVFGDTDFWFRMNPNGGQELFIGLAGHANGPLGNEPGRGLSVLAGWDPHLADRTDIDQHLLFMRCV